jgi:HSP20 family protein
MEMEVTTVALVRFDPYREIDRLFRQWPATLSAGSSVPMDAYRDGDSFVIKLDLPGIRADDVDLTVEDNVLSVTATRMAAFTTEGVEMLVSERPSGTFTRQVLLGNNLDTEHIDAQYEAGVLTLTIPVAAHAKPRRIEITERADRQAVEA